MHGTQLTPLVLFWDRDTRPHPSELSPQDLDKVVFSATLAGSKFLATLGAYIATEQSDRQAAADNLNSFLLAFTFLRAYPLDPVGPKELDICTLEPDTMTLRPSQGTLGRLGSAFALYREFHLTVLREIQPLVPFCDAKALPKIVELADKMAVSGYQRIFSAALNANSARGNGELTVAFLGFWLLLEMLVAEELTRFMRSQGTPQAIIDASLRGWSLYDRLALFKRWGVSQPLGLNDPTIFSRPELKEIRKLAGVRNRIMHSGHRPGDQEVERVAKLGWRAAWRFLRFAGIEYGPYLDTVNAIQTAFATKHRLP